MNVLKQLTIRPSPLPRSITEKVLLLFIEYLMACITLATWVVVAGTYGRTMRRNAGVTKGSVTTIKPVARPPKMPTASKPYDFLGGSDILTKTTTK